MTLKKLSDEYAQYEKNCTLSFALASMMYDPWTHIVVCERFLGVGLQVVGGGRPLDIIRRFGSRKVVASRITSEGILRIIVELPAV